MHPFLLNRMAFQRGSEGKIDEHRLAHKESEAQYDTGRYDMPQQPHHHGLLRTPSEEYRGYDTRGHRTESESSDDRRKVRKNWFLMLNFLVQ